MVVRGTETGEVDEDSGDTEQRYEDGGEIFSSHTENTTTKDLPSGESNTPSWSWGAHL